MRLFCWNGKTFNSKITLNRHISSIRAIHAIKDRSSNSSFVASCGGRGQLIMWQALECKGWYIDRFEIEVKSEAWHFQDPYMLSQWTVITLLILHMNLLKINSNIATKFVNYLLNC